MSPVASIAILPDEDTLFLALRGEGHTVAEIAKALGRGEAWVKKRPALLAARGVAVPAVAIGRPTRAGDSVARAPKPAPRQTPKPAPRAAPQPPSATPPTAASATGGPPGVDLFSLTDKSCRWPFDLDMDDAAATRFCGARAAPGQPYCPGHRAVAWRRARPRDLSECCDA